MNIDSGAEFMQELAQKGKIRIPKNFLVTNYGSLNKIDLNEVSKNSPHGISIYIGVQMGWHNASYYAQRLRPIDSDNYDFIPNCTLKKHGCSIQEAQEFLENRENIAKVTNAAYKQNAFENEESLKIVTYQTWKPEDVLFTFFATIYRHNNAYKIFACRGNPNGYEIEPQQTITCLGNEKFDYEGELLFNSDITKEILRQLRNINSGSKGNQVLEEIETRENKVYDLIVEGHIMNTTYPESGIIIIDIYINNGFNRMFKIPDHHRLWVNGYWNKNSNLDL